MNMNAIVVLITLLVIIFYLKGSTLLLGALIGLNSWVCNTLIIFTALTQFRKIQKLKKLGICIILNIALNFVISHNWILNAKLPISLWVGTLNWHPPLFYCVVTLYIALQLNKNILYISLLLRLTYFSQIKGLTITLILGSLWALQSLTWGYFWVNDGIEWALLLIIIIITNQQHQKTVLSISTYSMLNLVLIVTLLIALRLNLIPTRHAFLSMTPIIYKLFILYLGIWALSLTPANPLNLIKLKTKQDLESLILWLIILVMINKQAAVVTLKSLSIGFIGGFFKITSYAHFTILQFLLHYLIFFTLIVWLLQTSMFTLYFLTKKSLYTKNFSLYKLSFVISGKILAAKNLVKVLLEKITLYSDASLFEYYVLSWNLQYSLISLNALGFIVFLICLFL